MVAKFKAAHADLTRLLMTGRSGEAVAQFLGGRITDKVQCLSSLYFCSLLNFRSKADLCRL
jgi:hypothetical protein